MDAEGLDLAVLFPSRGLFVLGLDSVEQIGADGLEPAYATAIARAYNDWMSDFCDDAPDRMFGAAMVAPHDSRGRGRSRRAAASRSSASRRSSSRPATVNRRPWHHPAYDPLWAEIQRLDVPIAFHGGGQTYLTPDFGLEVLDQLMLWHTFSQPLGIQFVTACLCGGGVLERFPDLRVALLEGNCSWAPWFLYRLDEHYEWTGWYEAPELTMPPSEYFKRNCWISVEADEETAPHFIEHVRRRAPGLLDRLPARRLEVPARRRRLRQAADVRRRPRPSREHELVGPLRDPAGQAGLTQLSSCSLSATRVAV